MAALLATLVATRCSFASIPGMAEPGETCRLHAHGRLVVVQLMDDTENLGTVPI